MTTVDVARLCLWFSKLLSFCQAMCSIKADVRQYETAPSPYISRRISLSLNPNTDETVSGIPRERL